MLRSNPPHLPFDIITIIAHVSISAYRALLALPRFGRASLNYKHQLTHQSSFLLLITDNSNNRRWYLNGKRHRLDGPAVITANGDKYWYTNDKIHRLDGPAIIYASSNQYWCLNGITHHRLDGPAIICKDGTQHWFLNGQRHRCDGPAIIRPNGNEEYWIKGKRVTKEQTMGNIA
jgi:hypothetical protein